MDDGLPDDVWEAPDGTFWFYTPAWGEWTGWEAGEEGHWQLDRAEFRRAYPSAPGWDQQPS